MARQHGIKNVDGWGMATEDPPLMTLRNQNIATYLNMHSIIPFASSPPATRWLTSDRGALSVPKATIFTNRFDQEGKLT